MYIFLRQNIDCDFKIHSLVIFLDHSEINKNKESVVMFNRFSKEQQQIIQSIQDFFLEVPSDFAAERVFDFIKESVAIHFYNIGIQDAHAAVLSHSRHSTMNC
ncbi:MULTISPECIES: DUF2164 family protein [unclassified Exiguobacterium]|uniref:DUF2164 family protein n=2 Tax=Exiguobacterium TaxID=33986 RepID=UPI0028ABFDFC|nr:DUF2164 family protein [Exiguobacterium sp.]